MARADPANARVHLQEALGPNVRTGFFEREQIERVLGHICQLMLGQRAASSR